MLEVLPEDMLLTNDAGNFSIFIHRYWRYNHPYTQLASTNGAMGYGVPAAVAAKLGPARRRSTPALIRLTRKPTGTGSRHVNAARWPSGGTGISNRGDLPGGGDAGVTEEGGA